MDHKIDLLQPALEAALAGKIHSLVRDRGELTLTVKAADYLGVCTTLRDHAELKLEQLIDLCGLDYSSYKDGAGSPYTEGPRYCVACHMTTTAIATGIS